jgi:hypothetical protein
MRLRLASISLGLLTLLCACATGQSSIGTAVAPTGTAEPSDTPAAVVQTADAAIEVAPGARGEITRPTAVEMTAAVEPAVEVTATLTGAANPTASSTPTTRSTPCDLPPLTPRGLVFSESRGNKATAEWNKQLCSPKDDGVYIVGVEIMPGEWESTGTGSDCYWARLDDSEQVLDSHFGMAGGTVTIRPTDHAVEFDGCGTWLFVDRENGR